MHTLSLYGAIANRYQHLRTIRTVAMMNTISHQIERQVLKHKMPIDFYAGFQRFSAFPQQLQHYQRLGSVCQRVNIFGFPDITPPSIPGVEFIELTSDIPMTKEWFLLVDAPEFWTLLSTREIEGRDPITGQRRFDGVWTFDAPVVESASQLLARALGRSYTPHYQRHVSLQDQNVTEVMERVVASLEKKRASADSSQTE
jgi:DICT domain-containing protein